LLVDPGWGAHDRAAAALQDANDISCNGHRVDIGSPALGKDRAETAQAGSLASNFISTVTSAASTHSSVGMLMPAAFQIRRPFRRCVKPSP
jgi:hypothetical protein